MKLLLAFLFSVGVIGSIVFIALDKEIPTDKESIQAKVIIEKDVLPVNEPVVNRDEEEEVTSPKVSTSIVAKDQIIKDVRENLENHQAVMKEKILKLDNDLLNKELQQDLKTQLQGASEYRKNILIKAKQEMQAQGNK